MPQPEGAELERVRARREELGRELRALAALDGARTGAAP